MPSQSIVWTTLPNGFATLPDGRRLPCLSVYVAPRLIPSPGQQTLQPFKLFLDWPAVVAKGLRFKLVLNNGGPAGQLEPIPGDDAPDPSLWRRLFDETTFVRGHTFTDLKDVTIRSFPATSIHAYLDNLYNATAAASPSDLPERQPSSSASPDPLGRLARDLGHLTDPQSWQRYEKLLGETLGQAKALPPGYVPPGFPSAETFAFQQATRFYKRPAKPTDNPYFERPDLTRVPPRPAPPKFDFHQALAAFGDYPRLLRRLGLVIDLVWTNPVPLASSGRVRVEVEWLEPGLLPSWHEKDMPPWTAYRFEGNHRFAARDALEQTGLHHGCLDLSSARDEPVEPKKPAPYLVSQLDLDGGAIKAVDFAASLVRMTRPDVSNYRTPARAGLPALRTGALAVYRNGRAFGTHRQLTRASAAQAVLAAAGRPEFFAEDLLRGFRVDVWDDVSKVWHTLCAREGRYLFSKGGKLLLELADEGYVKAASASRAEAGSAPDLYLHERLAAFDGWSLVAARPGRVLDKDPSAAEPAVPVEGAGAQFGFATKFRPAAGSLPRLRFGRSYRLRIRTVDIAGNGLGAKDADETRASAPFLYVRYEPVPSPVVLPRTRFTEGESLERLVIRSDYDTTAAGYLARALVKEALEGVRDRLGLEGEARDGYAYAVGNERHLAPPKISQLEAELHGCFDAYIGPGKDHAQGFRLAQREAGTFLSQTIVDLDTGAEKPIPGLDLEVVPPTGKAPTDLDDPARQPGDPLQEGEYVLHKEARLVVPYLPDPFARGVVFMGLPGWPATQPFIVEFEGEWPDPTPFRLRLVERPGTMDGCDQTFTTDGEPKWDEAKRVLTVFLPKGVEAVVRYSSLPPKAALARQLAWWKTLEQRGTLTAALRNLILKGRHWMFTPWRTLTLVHAVQHPLCAPRLVRWAPSRQVGDTFAALRGSWHLSVKSTAKIDITAAWQEPVDDVAQPTWQVLDRSAHVAEVPIETVFNDQHPIPATETGAPPLSQQPLLHEFGDTKHRRVRYRLKGTTRFREYFPVEITRIEEAIVRLGPEYSPEAGKPGIVVPSSARPSAPRPVYALPTFLWEERTLAGGGWIRTRRGNGVRVYLERPWWSSGEGERLGVVFKTGAIANRHKPLVTEWGLDPVFASPNPVAGPTLAAFPLRKESSDGNLSLEELGTGERTFSVAGHSVEFDEQRKLWFSDIVAQNGRSYFPFVRLALARYQPYSILDCHLSRVVQTDFIQLVPDRTLDLRPNGTRKYRVKIFGPAPTETYVSRILSSATVRSMPAPKAAADVLPSLPTSAQIANVFRPGELTAIAEAGRIPGNIGGLLPKPEPAAASQRPGLNQYSVTLEKLPKNASPDFGWVVDDRLTVTKPPTPPTPSSSPAPKLPKGPATQPTVARRTTPAATVTATSRTAALQTAAGKKALETAAGRLVATNPDILALPPLWEADLNLPVINDGLPRRLVVQEHELYFKATPNKGEIIPIARRLVYADIVPLD